MTLLASDLFGPIIESLISRLDANAATSLFHHRRVEDHRSQIEEDSARMVVTVAPLGDVDQPLDLLTCVEALQEPATRIRGIRRRSWGTSGHTFRFSDGDHPSLTIHRHGEIEYCEPHLIEAGAVVGVRVLLPIIGSIVVARRLARETDLAGSFQIDVSLLGVGGSHFHTPTERVFLENYAFDRDRVHQRGVIEINEERPDVAIRPLADMLWQASGFARCHQYDDEDRWEHWSTHFD